MFARLIAIAALAALGGACRKVPPPPPPSQDALAAWAGRVGAVVGPLGVLARVDGVGREVCVAGQTVASLASVTSQALDLAAQGPEALPAALRFDIDVSGCPGDGRPEDMPTWLDPILQGLGGAGRIAAAGLPMPEKAIVEAVSDLAAALGGPIADELRNPTGRVTFDLVVTP